MIDAQYTTGMSQLDCAVMPVEPTAWYGINSLELTDDGIYYEWISFARGVKIINLHRIIDGIKQTEKVRCFIWIQRLTDKEAKELGL